MAKQDNTTQFSIEMQTKNRLDRYKAKHKQTIIDKYEKKRRMATNTDVIRFLLDEVEAE